MIIPGNSCLNKKNIYGHSRSFTVIHVQKNLLLAGERDLVDLVVFFLLLGVSPREIYKSYKLSN